mgnify:FL=1
MSDIKVISAKDFISKATRIIDISGFDKGDEISVRIKPVSLMTMMVNGKLGNDLLPLVQNLFKQNQSKSIMDSDLMENSDNLKLIISLMDRVCEEVLVEPTFDEIGEYLTDTQKQEIFTAAQGTVEATKPSF